EIRVMCPWEIRVMCPWEIRVMCPWEIRVMCPWENPDDLACRRRVASELAVARTIRLRFPIGERRRGARIRGLRRGEFRLET
ncbi:hypothetical protein, partial [Microbacterium sp.]|uniref:hypothetical protein n=1 Tax=Microbacterium sp. TaxID=51671 RepID=UPI0027349419